MEYIHYFVGVEFSSTANVFPQMFNSTSQFYAKNELKDLI